MALCIGIVISGLVIGALGGRIGARRGMPPPDVAAATAGTAVFAISALVIVTQTLFSLLVDRDTLGEAISAGVGTAFLLGVLVITIGAIPAGLLSLVVALRAKGA